MASCPRRHPQRSFCRRAILLCRYDDELQAGTPSFSIEVVSGGFPATIPKFGPEIKNRCKLEGFLEGFPATILKFGLEIKNRCTLMGISGENPASIPKSGLEIKNHCTLKGIS